jgi:FKBP-type peptidyl-prolyl cis-trans isomerase 2
MDKNIIAGLMLVILLSGCVGTEEANVTTQIAPPIQPTLIVEKGDVVSANYIGILKETGEVFDTSYESIAYDTSIPKVEWFQLRQKYEPLQVTAGSGQVIEGFDEALLGMAINEEKEVIITPAKGYGEWNPELVIIQPRIVEILRIVETPLEEFRLGIGKEPVVNETVQLRYWPGKILNVSDTSVTLRHDPINDSIVQTMYGPSRVILNSTMVKMELIPIINETVQTSYGIAKILGFNDTTVKVDFNSPLAGKTLIFKIKVERIIKASEFAEMQIAWISDLPKALEKAKAEAKPLIIEFYVEWCGWCKMLDEKTFPDLKVLEKKDEFIWVKINAEKQSDLAMEYNVKGFPLLVFLKSDGNEIKRINRYVTAEELRAEMDSVF